MIIDKKKIHGKEAREKMMAGIDKAVNVVGSTMGAKGRNVIVDRKHGSPLCINDGVTILNEVFSNDSLENMAIALVKDASNRTNATAGDGTTGTAVLTRAIVKEGWKMIETGKNPVMLRKEILKACDEVEANLKKLSKKIKTKKQAIDIATISVQDEDLGKKIGSLMFDLGKSGAVSIKNSLDKGVFIEKEAGMRIEGALQAGFLNQTKWEAKIEKTKVLILQDSPEDHELESKWLPFFKQFASRVINSGIEEIVSHVPRLVIVAEKLSPRFIKMMSLEENKNLVQWVWFRPTTADKNMKEIYKDIQSITGGKNVKEEDGVFLKQMTIDDLGYCDNAKATRHELVLTVDKESLNNDRFLDRVADVKGQIKESEDETEKRQTEERYANLTGGVATIKVSAATDQDTLELKLRIEDAINATRSAMDEGYVAGGGIALINSSNVTETDGGKVLKEACKGSLKQILYNAGLEDNIIQDLKQGEGIDVIDEKVVNMCDSGIIDPTKVIRLSLINAVSVSALLLTSEYVITDEEDDMRAVKDFFTKK